MKYSEAYHNALELQRLVMKDARLESTEPSVRANIARAFVTLEELKRLIRGKPGVKPVDADKLVRPRRTPVEPSFTEQ